MEYYPKSVNENREAEVRETELPLAAHLQKNQIVELLKTGGTENTEAMERMNKWLDAEEARVSADHTERARVILETARANFYLAVKDKEGALECLNDACTVAEQEGHFDLLDIAEERIKIIRKLD